MAIFTRYAKVLDTAGDDVSVRDALELINQTLDEILTEQEGDFDRRQPVGVGSGSSNMVSTRATTAIADDAVEGQEHELWQGWWRQVSLIPAQAKFNCFDRKSFQRSGTQRTG